jgi:hypothetical protein
MIELMDSRRSQSGQRKLGVGVIRAGYAPLRGALLPASTPANAHVTRKAQRLTEPLQSTLEPRHLHAPLPQPKTVEGHVIDVFRKLDTATSSKHEGTD